MHKRLAKSFLWYKRVLPLSNYLASKNKISELAVSAPQFTLAYNPKLANLNQSHTSSVTYGIMAEFDALHT